MRMKSWFLATALTAISTASLVTAADWVVYDGFDGPGKGKHIVLVSGDEEYRSEELVTQLGRILAKHHGFKCTVLYALDPKTSEITPTVINNIPGLEALKTADLMIIFTRFRDLPDDQMKQIVDYVEAGKPVLGIRTATHAFNIKKGATYYKYTHNNNDPAFEGGFGRQVLGEKWINHHGHHKVEATRGIFAAEAAEHPILRGIKDGEIFGPSDVYTVRLPLPDGCKPLVMGQVLKGMKPEDPPLDGPKNNPMMPIAWTKTYKGARVFTSTMGSAADFDNAPFRRLLVNASYWCVSLENKIPAANNVDIVGEWKPTFFGFGQHVKGIKPDDLKLK
jgi:type 1 glutamine amidotransferase